MVNFLPMEEVKNCFQVIKQKLGAQPDAQRKSEKFGCCKNTSGS